MKLFEQEKVPFKVKRGLKRFLRKSKFKPNKATKESLGLLKHPKVKRVSRIAQVNLICLPILFMWDYGLFLIPIIIGAVQMFDWGQDVSKLSPGNRILTRSNEEYWFCAMVSAVDNDVYIIESRDGGANWGKNHPDYDDDAAEKLNGYEWSSLPGGDYRDVSICIIDNNRLHLVTSLIHIQEYEWSSIWHTYLDNSCLVDIAHTNWHGFNESAPQDADEISHRSDEADWGHVLTCTMAAMGNNVCIAWAQRRNARDEIYYNTHDYEDDADGGSWYVGKGASLTESSSDHNTYPALDVDSNNHIHCVFQNSSGDNKIKYMHSHVRLTSTFYQSDDTTPITTGESGETVLTEAGKDFSIPSICTNALPDYLDDIWVSGYLTGDELYATQYDKSEGNWEAKAKFSATDQVDANGQLGMSADGKIQAIWSRKTIGGIRHSEYDVSWSAPETLQS